MRKLALLIGLLVLALPAFSTTWYVRPAGGSYGAENGTSYANAWDGLLNVVWGGAGVVAGDTLYICGTHVHDCTGMGAGLVTQADVTPQSGSAGSVVTIRGDYAGDAGTVWGFYKLSYTTWAQQSAPNTSVWAYDIIGAHTRFYAEISGTTFTAMSSQASVAACQANNESYFYDDATGLLYVNHGGTDPTGKIYASEFGHEFKLTGKAYITFLNLAIYGHDRWCESTESFDNITWNGCTIAYPSYNGINLYDNSDAITITGCTIRNCANGIYIISNGGAGVTNYTFSSNTIYNCANPGGDAHAIGIYWNADNGLIEGNTLYNCGDGVVIYAGANISYSNIIIRKNFIRDMTTGGGLYNARGIDLGGDNTLNGTFTGIQVYENAIDNCTIGLRSKWVATEIDVFNNVAANCTDTSYSFFEATGGRGAIIEFKNNASLSPTTRHISFSSTGTGAALTSNYNDFYPNTGTLFRYGTTNYNFADWQTATSGDANSIVTDPAFLNAGGSYNLTTDYQVEATSPLVNAGVNVGLTSDLFGNAIPTGGAPDIGVHEYQSGGGGEGAPEMAVTYSGTALVDGGTYDYAQRQVGLTTDVEFTITNAGDAALTLTTPIALAGANADQFSITAQPTSPVAASGTTTFTVRFAPTSTGTKTATIAITNDDADENPYNITLTGIGGGGARMAPGTRMKLGAGTRVRI